MRTFNFLIYSKFSPFDLFIFGTRLRLFNSAYFLIKKTYANFSFDTLNLLSKRIIIYYVLNATLDVRCGFLIEALSRNFFRNIAKSIETNPENASVKRGNETIRSKKLFDAPTGTQTDKSPK